MRKKPNTSVAVSNWTRTPGDDGWESVGTLGGFIIRDDAWEDDFFDECEDDGVDLKTVREVAALVWGRNARHNQLVSEPDGVSAGITVVGNDDDTMELRVTIDDNVGTVWVSRDWWLAATPKGWIPPA